MKNMSRGAKTRFGGGRCGGGGGVGSSSSGRLRLRELMVNERKENGSFKGGSRVSSCGYWRGWVWMRRWRWRRRERWGGKARLTGDVADNAINRVTSVG